MEEPAGVIRVPFSREDIAAHDEHDHIAASFPDREHASAAVADLCELGLGSEHLGAAVHGDASVVFEHDMDSEWPHDVAVGAVVGAPIGAIAGVAMAALAVPGLGVLGLGGTLAFAGASALWGSLLGGYTGATVGDVGWTAHEDLSYAALQPGEVLVVVCSHGHGDAVRDVMRRHDGELRAVEPHVG